MLRNRFGADDTSFQLGEHTKKVEQFEFKFEFFYRDSLFRRQILQGIFQKQKIDYSNTLKKIQTK